MIGWMQNWDACAIRSEEAPWAGQMSLPREIHIRDGRLYQWPIREFDELRHDRVEYKGVEVSEEKVCLDGISGRMVDMEIRVRPKDPASSYNKFVIRFAEEGETCTSLYIHPLQASRVDAENRSQIFRFTPCDPAPEKMLCGGCAKGTEASHHTRPLQL